MKYLNKRIARKPYSSLHNNESLCPSKVLLTLQTPQRASSFILHNKLLPDKPILSPISYLSISSHSPDVWPFLSNIHQAQGQQARLSCAARLDADLVADNGLLHAVWKNSHP